MFKKLLTLLGAGLLVLVSVLTINTLRFTTETDQVQVEPASFAVDEHGVVQRLAAALAIPTISKEGMQAADYLPFRDLQVLLEQSFPRVFSQLLVERVNEYSYLIKWQGSNPKLRPAAFLAHTDVVPISSGTENDWFYPPFAGEVAKGYIWGRGAIDNKAGVLGLLEATEALLAQGYRPERSLYLALGHDEEIGGLEGAGEIARLLKSRGEELEFVLDEGGYIVRDALPGVEGLVAVIGTGEKGFISLRLTAKGMGGHSSQPPALTAAGRIARAVHRIQENPFPIQLDHSAEFMRALGSNVPFAQRMIFANTWLFEPIATLLMPPVPSLLAGMRTTTAPTMLRAGVKENVLPASAEAVINFRIYPGESTDSVKRRVTELVDDPEVRFQQLSFVSEPSKTSRTDSFAYQQLARSIHQVKFGEPLLIAPRLVLGATDARHYGDVAVDSYRFMGLTVTPEDATSLHGTNERIGVKSYLDTIRIYAQFIRNTTGS